MQAFPAARLEVYANTSFMRATANIYGLDYDSTRLAGPTPGLDWTLMNQSFGGFSDLKIRQIVQSVGLNYRLSEALALNAGFEWNDYRDSQPYLFDTTGRRITYLTGVSWIF